MAPHVYAVLRSTMPDYFPTMPDYFPAPAADPEPRPGCSDGPDDHSLRARMAGHRPDVGPLEGSVKSGGASRLHHIRRRPPPRRQTRPTLVHDLPSGSFTNRELSPARSEARRDGDYQRQSPQCTMYPDTCERCFEHRRSVRGATRYLRTRLPSAANGHPVAPPTLSQ